MSKILVNLSVPAASESIDVLVPDFLRIRTLVPLLVDSITDLKSAQYIASNQECLCCQELHCILDPMRTVKECGIKNGYHLYLI